MHSRSTRTIYIAPDCPPEVEAHIRKTEHGARILGRSLVGSKPKHIPGPRVDLPGQLELPQTEERQAELARLKAAQSLKPSTAQKPCDIGLFSDDANQISLFDRSGRP